MIIFGSAVSRIALRRRSPIYLSGRPGFARRPHEKRNVGLRNCEAGRIDRRGERGFVEPPQEPIAEFLPLKAQRRLQPAWKNRSRCCGLSRAQPCIVASTRSVRRISRPFKTVSRRVLRLCGSTTQRDVPLISGRLIR